MLRISPGPYARRLFSLGIAIVFVVATCSGARADGQAGSIVGVAADRPAPRAGESIVVRIAIAPPVDVWAAKSYSARVQLRDAVGSVLADSAEVVGNSATAAGQFVVLPVTVVVPDATSGPLSVRATVTHAGAIVGDDTSTSIVVGAVVPESLAPEVGAAPGSTPPVARPKTLTADINATSNYGKTPSQQSNYTVGAKFTGDRSLTSTFGLATTIGAPKPIVGYQTSQTLTQVGTFSPSFDSGVLSGPSGTGFTYKDTIGARSVQLAFLSGAHATQNPFTIAAINTGTDILGGTLTLTGGNVWVTGAANPGSDFFLRNGMFAGLQFAKKPNAANFSYSLRYGVIDYLDDVIKRHRTDRVFQASSIFTISKVGFMVDIVRAGPYFPTLTAPGITPDREAATLTATVLVGKVNLTGSLITNRDALNGSFLTQKTHFWTESIGADYALRNGDSIGLKLSNAIQHQDGSQVAYNGNDNTGITYNLRRGVYGLAFTVASTTTRSSTGILTHTIQDGVSVTRTVGEGFSINGALNTTNALANQNAATSFLNAVNGGVGWTRGPVTLSTSLSRSLSRPGYGVSDPAALSINYGVAVKPFPSLPYAISITAAQAHGASASTVGALNLSRSL